jgi:hypothetical protein
MQKMDSILPNISKRKNKVAVMATFSKTMLLGLTITLFSYNLSNAQLTATGQIRPRVEIRGGQGTLQPENTKSAAFTSQRTRLNVGFSGYRFKIFASIQDVRVWGQDASTINRTTTDANDGVLLNEAWGEIILNDTISSIENLSIKAGRQEISYDDQKVLGGLDWLQQGRRHDALLLKYANKGWIADLGFAFNQNRELNNTTIFNGTNTAYPAGTNGIGTLYKSFQYLYVGKKFFFGDLSFLFFNEDFNQYTVAPGGTPPVPTKTYNNGVWSRNTTGIYFNTTIKRQLNLTGSIYHQGGHDKDGVKVNANLFSITSTLQLGRKWFVGPGVDYLSGNDGTQAATENNRFDPLYGTPHKFWGYMDYFYVASPFGNQGLLNYFFKAKYNFKDNLTFMLDIHGFQSANKVSDGAGGERSPYLGTEIDFTARYNLTKMIGMEVGYARMQATNTMASAQVKNVANADLTPHFGYIMLTIKPNFLAKK